MTKPLFQEVKKGAIWSRSIPKIQANVFRDDPGLSLNGTWAISFVCGMAIQLAELHANPNRSMRHGQILTATT
jgi:hypothetical protein